MAMFAVHSPDTFLSRDFYYSNPKDFFYSFCDTDSEQLADWMLLAVLAEAMPFCGQIKSWADSIVQPDFVSKETYAMLVSDAAQEYIIRSGNIPNDISTKVSGNYFPRQKNDLSLVIDNMYQQASIRDNYKVFKRGEQSLASSVFSSACLFSDILCYFDRSKKHINRELLADCCEWACLSGIVRYNCVKFRTPEETRDNTDWDFGNEK
jgi:hypothetical protein